MRKNNIDRFMTWARNLRSPELFSALERRSRGDVLDVGGWDFFETVRANPRIAFKTWTSLEEGERLLETPDARYRAVTGNGEKMAFPDASFDTVLNIQVLEHTFDPLAMVREISRVLRPGGTAIFLIPQTSVLHHPPKHYYNFTRFWIIKAADVAGLRIDELSPLGGRWTSTASHMVHFFFQAFRATGYSTAEDRRGPLFYLLLPLMCLYAALSVPICLLLSLGDLTEEANNHLVVARKP
jgi:SAM-dependent methyltransferase